MVRRIISLFCVVVILFSCCLSVHADLADAGEYYVTNFWDALQGKDIDVGFKFWKNITGYFVGQECPSSPDKYHHGPKPAFGSSSGGSDENGRFSWATCEYCGKQFKVYSSFVGGSGGGFSKSDLQQSYEAQVEELPATGYTSDGSLFWSPKTLYMSFRTGVYNGPWNYCPDYPDGKGSSSEYAITFNCDSKNFSVRPLSGKLEFYLTDVLLGWDDPFPIDGFYKQIVSPAFQQTAIDANSVPRSGEVFYSAVSSASYYNSGDFLFSGARLLPMGGNRWKIFSAQCYPPVYEVTSFTLPGSSDIYNINSRPTSITGDYGIIGDNGQIIKVEGDKIVNETNNNYYNPVTGETHTLSDWSYNYEDRSYIVTTESGDTVTITYGDENVTIKEGDTIYNIYYLVDGSGSENPDPGPGPEVCDHTWTETSRTEPTCTTAGKVTSTCSKCNQTKTETIPAIGHSWVVDRTVQTTYDEEGNLLQQGYTIYSCSVCGEQYKDMEGTGPPGPEEEKSIWEKLGDLIGSGFGGIIEIIEATLPYHGADLRRCSS